MKKKILESILFNKIEWLKIIKKKKPLHNFMHLIKKTNNNFKNSLKNNFPAFIFEIKKTSPSLGKICKNFNIHKIVNSYNKYASAISVITEEKYFHGNIKYLKKVRKNTNLPILCKDFFIDDYQIYLSRYYGADAILLILSILNNYQYKRFSRIAKSMNLKILTEINNVKELNRAIFLNAEIIGINNRNLNDFSININTTKILSPLIPKNKIIISESGIKNNIIVNELKKYVNGFLIGSSVMSENNINLKIKKIIFGNNKICGLIKKKDAEISEKNGAIYGGLIFVKSSKRNISIKNAINIINYNFLKYIGVFQNEDFYKIKDITNKLNLHAVQLHGNENQKYINSLKSILNKNTKIWKAVCIKNDLPNYKFDNVDKIIFDNYVPGSGNSFNWSILNNINLKNIFLSGGINIKNFHNALKFKPYGLDFNSGVEKNGIKNHNKIKKLFNKIKTTLIKN
ncbi:bifunctional indole-3-glycerol-phosphate synthase TrpC/phosphoribosylanthranilate isomerase TrpF [Buchnera aphidicola (Ceratoglyphina bambusae)]|uniref:bifunctional indole-3-glycerol-phosphate synthase TrpC/phosphoribosylanthranilate isomerase TrpF n=1 Tax=Buchnera aphidicola TaxID=9 RepID=UPI0031B89AA2